MQHMDVQTILNRAKKALNLKTDIDLAEFLDVPRSTIASWKRRGSIPARYLAEFTSSNISLDWLLTGQGTDEKTAAFGFSSDEKQEIDIEAFWLSLVLAVRSISARDKNVGEGKSFITDISRDELKDFAIYVMREYNLVKKSKRAWEASKIGTDTDVFKALLHEYQLKFDVMANPPWWEDD